MGCKACIEIAHGHVCEIEWSNWLMPRSFVLDCLSVKWQQLCGTRKFRELAHGHNSFNSQGTCALLGCIKSDWLVPRNSMSTVAITNEESGRPWPAQILQLTFVKQGYYPWINSCGRYRKSVDLGVDGSIRPWTICLVDSFVWAKFAQWLCAELYGEQNLLSLISNLPICLVQVASFLLAEPHWGCLQFLCLLLIKTIFANGEQIARVAFCN